MEKLDRDRYRKNVESKTQDISLETVSLSDLNAKLQVFCDVLVDAAEKCAPCIRRGKNKRLWSDELKAASIKGKHVLFQWKKAGRPGPQHPLSIHCRIAKKHLRSTQRRQQAALQCIRTSWRLTPQIRNCFSPLSIDNAKSGGMRLASFLLMTDISQRKKPLERVGHLKLRDWPLQWMITHTMKVLNNKLIWTLISSVTYRQVSRIVYQKFLVKQLRGLSSH